MQLARKRRCECWGKSGPADQHPRELQFQDHSSRVGTSSQHNTLRLRLAMIVKPNV